MHQSKENKVENNCERQNLNNKVNKQTINAMLN